MVAGHARCVAPGCARVPEAGHLCPEHAAAPPGQRGGWLSAARRRPVYEATQVSPRLWVGPAPPTDRDLPDLDIVVLAAQEVQPELACYHGGVMRCPLPDAELNLAQVRHVAVCGVAVAHAIGNGRRVLVTCRAGLNRSSLVAGIALGQLTTMPADKIIEVIRSRRGPAALSNPSFVELLRRLVGDGRPRARRRRVARVPQD